jgi:hypothetical protein
MMKLGAIEVLVAALEDEGYRVLSAATVVMGRSP